MNKNSVITGFKKFIAGFALVVSHAAIAIAGDVSCEIQQAEVLFSKCKICHQTTEGENHTIGPNLFGVYERQIGSVPGFKFSKAVRTAARSWNDENLDAFLRDPQVFLPRNKMAFSGLKRESERNAVICYLKTLRR